ncbi:MAG TPA: hypothetical protein VNN08_16440 [Thermoanaerobaculia bacterium]|nr:hypothetical protein [Thermoanaerobaculia bacterium]
MSAPIIVPRDKTLDQVLSAGQVSMLIIGSSQRASELAVLAGEISDRDELGGATPRCAVQVTSDAAVGAALRQEIGETPDPTIVTLKRDGTVVRAVVDDGEIDQIDLEDMFLEAGI